MQSHRPTPGRQVHRQHAANSRLLPMSTTPTMLDCCLTAVKPRPGAGGPGGHWSPRHCARQGPCAADLDHSGDGRRGRVRIGGQRHGRRRCGECPAAFHQRQRPDSHPPELWRHGAGCVPFLHPWNGKIVNKVGDAYTFKVFRACRPLIDFRGKGGEFRINLFQNLSNRSHVLDIVAVGDGSVRIRWFDIFESPLH